MTNKADFWTPAQAVAWGISRDEEYVSGLSKPAASETLKAQSMKCKRGQKVTCPRQRVDGIYSVSTRDAKIPFLTGTDALNASIDAVLSGQIFHQARDV